MVEAGVDAAAALAAAEERGERVEVLTARTEYSQTFATPRATFVVEEHIRPQWARTAEGAWVDADPTLVRSPDGSLRPRAATVDMSFSGGGESPLATIGADSASVSLRWPESLPEPVLEGNVATYPGVAPQVDLRVVVDVDSFTHLVVIHSPKALEDPLIADLRLQTELTGVALRVVETGAVEAVDGAGEVVFTGPSPMMWDSRDTAGATPPEAKPEPGPDAQTGPGMPGAAGAGSSAEPAAAPVAVELADDALRILPDAAMLADPDTVYPVYVDPTWSKATGKRNKWSLLRKSFPSSSFYNPPVGSTSSSDATRGIVRAGFVVEDRTYTDRSIFNMSTSAVRFKRVNKATFSLTQAWSWFNCGHSSPPATRLRSVGSFSSSTTWNSQPSWGSTLASSKKIRKYGHSCGPQRVEFNITSHVRSAADSGKSSVNLGLRAASETTGSWTRFRIDAKLAMEYNTAPNAPTTVRVTGKGCATGSSRPFVTVDRPTFSARASDKDSGQQSLTTRFYWWQSGSSRDSGDFVSGTSANPGTANSASVPSSKALADDTVYRYQARTSDGIDVTWSSVCEFRTSLTPPDPPAQVVSTTYPEHDPGDPGTGSGGVGIAGQFTISPPGSGVGDVVGYAYTLDAGIAAAAAPTVAKQGDGSAAVTLLPARDGVNVLRVWTKDVAGRFSSVVEYEFRVRPGDGPAARWQFDDPQDPGADDTGHGNSLAISGGASVTAGRAGVGEALSLNGSTAYAGTSAPLVRPHPDDGTPLTVRTDASFTVAAWARLDQAGGGAQRVVVAAHGDHTSAFLLGYSGPDDRWRFAMANQDVVGSTLPWIYSDAAPVVGRWTHLAASFDAATHEMRLYVNGVLQADSNTSAGFYASGPVEVGRRLWNDSHQDYFVGLVDDVRVYPYIPPVSELVEAARPLPPEITFPDGDSATVGGTLRVRFDAAGDTNVTSVVYSVGSDALDQSVSLDSPGGTATVTVPVTTSGDLPVFAAGVDLLARVSESASATAVGVGDPAVTGVVFDVVTEQPVAGATVMLDQAGLSVTSESDGSFSFDEFPAGVYTLAAHLGGQCGMATATDIDIEAPVVAELWLTPARDSFGYECQAISGVPFTPVSGVALSLTGDDAVAEIALPFEFSFYGEQHTNVWVDTNGFVTFEDPGGSHPGGDTNMPSPSEPDALIAAYWSDLVVDGAASIHTQTTGTAPLRTFTIEWREAHLQGDPGARVDIQLSLWENGFIVLHYRGLDTALERGQSAVVGLESPGGQLGVQYAYRQSALENNLQVFFVYPEDPTPITTVELSGTVVDALTGLPAAGVEVTLDPAEASVVTEPDGGFSFPDLEWGSYLVEAQVGTHCGRNGHELVELEASAQVQLEIAPPTDEYGYRCEAGTQGFAPTSTTLGLTGDDSNQQVSLPFPVTFYGEPYSQVWVNTNGILIFAPQPFPWWAVHEIPSVHDSPSAAIYPFWSDWLVDGSASVRTGTNGSAPSRQFVVEWRNVRHVTDASARVSFQVVFSEESGEIAVAWDDIDAVSLERGSSGVVGIENADGTIALPYAVFEQAIASGQGVSFMPGDPGLHEVSGAVTCAGDPASGVSVKLAEQTTVTDSLGAFTFTGVAPGPQGLVATAATGPCAGSVSVPATAVRGEPQFVDVALVPVAEAAGYTVTRTATSMLSTGTMVTLPGHDGGDDELVAVTPPFPIELYGQSYSQAWLDTNGYLMFQNRGFPDALPFPIPSVDWSPDAAVYPFWNDWVVDSLASVRTGVHGSAPSREWVVEWRNVHPFNMWQRVSFQAVFSESTGEITFSYTGIDQFFVERGGAGLVGIESGDSTAAVQFAYLTPVVRTGEGLVFTPVAS